MIRFWRLDDVPELRDLPKRRQQVLWSEAMTRSTTRRRLLGVLAARFVASLALGGASLWLFPSISPLWPGLLALTVSGIVYEATVQAPAARRWLREHAHELDRYVPA